MKKFYFLLLGLFLFSGVNAQNPSDFDPSFNLFNLPLNNYHINATIKKSVILPDGKIVLIKGEKDLVRLQGNLADPSFNTGTGFTNTNGTTILTVFAVQPDGKIIVGGYFDKYNGVSKSRLLRLNQDGSLDTSFTLQGFNLQNYGAGQIEILPDGKILLLAEQTSIGGIYDNIKRLLPNGALDTSFITVPNYNFGTFTVAPDGKLLVTHNTNNNFYSQCNKVARLNPDGSFDSAFTTANFSITYGDEVNINKLLVLNSGKILVGGTFNGCNLQSSLDLIQLNANGSVDTSFNIGSGFVAESSYYRSDYVSDIVVQSDGKIIVGGRFYQFNGINKMNLVRLNANGSLDTAFADTNSFVNIGAISCVNLFSDEKILVSGSLGENKAADRYIAKINIDGTKDISFTNTCKGLFGGVNKLVTMPDGKILAGGSFFTYNDAKKVSFIRLNNDGSVDGSLNYGGGDGFLSGPSEGGVFAISTTAAGKIYLGGKFTTFNGETVNDIVRLNSDGSRDTGFNAGTGIDYGVYSPGRIKDILALPNGELVVAGNFSRYNGANCSGLIRTSSGSYGADFPNMGNDVTCLKLLNDGTLLIGLSHLGNYNYSLGALKKYITGSWLVDSNFVLDAGLSQGSVTSIEVQQDGKILLCGQFEYGGAVRSLVRILSNGSIDPTFNYSLQNDTFMIEEIALLPNQKIVVSYVDTLYGYSSKVIRLNNNGTIDSTFDQKIFNTDGSNVFLKSQSDGKIYVYGKLDNSVGNPGSGLNRLLGEDYNFVQGQNRIDSNNNGCDVNDGVFTNLKLHVSSGANNFDYIANTSGNYSAALASGSHTITPILENPTYFNVSPSVVNVTFPTQTSPLSQNFCVTTNGVHPDLEVTLLPLITARPGFDAKYKIIYKNKGNTAQSGSVNLVFNDAVLDLVTSNPVTSTQTINNLYWNFTNLLPFETREITVTLNVNSPMESPAVNGGDVLNYTTTIASAATDDIPNDNTLVFNQTVVNSFDPNDKTCLEGATISPAKVGDYVHYMIRFENTGTFPAENIVVKDMIDLAKFDIATLVPIKGSHLFTTRITSGNKVEFIFENINLPFDDANNDGYVAFKIKTKPSLVLGDTFSNTASIYFDYNFPIVTNTATTTIAVLATQDFVFSNYFTLYPNPVKDILNITAKETIEVTSINIYNTLGQLVLVIPNAQNTKTVDVSGLTKGNYFIKINSDKGTSNTKFIKN